MRALVLTTVLPSGRRTGGELVTQGVVDALRGRGWEVRVVGYARPGAGSRVAEGEVSAGSRPIETSAAGRRALGWMFRALAGRAPYSVAKYRSRAYVDAARAELARGADLVIADHAQAEFAVSALTPLGAPLVFVAHNLEAAAYEEVAAAPGSRARRHLHRREARLVGATERELAAAAAQVWTLTDADAAAFRSLAPRAAVHALKVPSLLEPPPGAAEPERDIALIGSWSWRPNALALEWFASEVVPLLPPGASVEVAGAGAEWLAGRHPNVAVRGVVPDAAEFMARARVVAVPAVAGTGVQIKTLDALACGVPVVATPTAARGLDDPPAALVVADGAREFADALARAPDVHERGAEADAALSWSRARRAEFAEQVASLAAALAPQRVVTQGSQKR